VPTINSLLAKRKRIQRNAKRQDRILNIFTGRDLEERIKSYHGGTITNYIIMTIQEKMGW